MKSIYKIISLIFAMTAISLAVFVLSYLYFPINIFDVGYGQLGTTAITTIQGSDTLKDSRTTINNNFSSLNANKVENSTTTFGSLVNLTGLTTASLLNTIGTIATGIWHGSVVDVLYGGTGRATLTPYRILLGNGTGGIATSTAGTSGQLLAYSSTSSPYWTSPSVNTAIDYSWSAIHTFGASTTFNGVGTTTIANNLYITGTTTIGMNKFLVTATTSEAVSFTTVNNANSSSTGMTITTDGTQRVMIIYSGYMLFGNTDSQVHQNYVGIYVDNVLYASYINQNDSNATPNHLAVGVNDAFLTEPLSAGTHTIKLYVLDSTAGTADWAVTGYGYAYTIK